MHDAELKELYERYGYHVYQRCRFLLEDDDDAWDATQEVFLKVERGLDSFEGRSGMLRWIDRIATNHCFNRLRAGRVRRGRGLVPVEDLEQEAAAGGQGGLDSELALAVRDLLAGVDVQTRAVAMYYYVEEMSQEEVAGQVGLSVPTVRKRLRQFAQRARRLLSEGAGGRR